LPDAKTPEYAVSAEDARRYRLAIEDVYRQHHDA
jgi:hypothetical protein